MCDVYTLPSSSRLQVSAFYCHRIDSLALGRCTPGACFDALKGAEIVHYRLTAFPQCLQAACYGRFYAGCAGAINAAEATAPLKDIIEASKAREAEAVAAAGASAAAAVAPAKVKKTKMVKVEKGAKTTVVPPPAAKKAPAQPTEEVLVKEANS